MTVIRGAERVVVAFVAFPPEPRGNLVATLRTQSDALEQLEYSVVLQGGYLAAAVDFL